MCSVCFSSHDFIGSFRSSLRELTRGPGTNNQYEVPAAIIYTCIFLSPCKLHVSPIVWRCKLLLFSASLKYCNRKPISSQSPPTRPATRSCRCPIQLFYCVIAPALWHFNIIIMGFSRHTFKISSINAADVHRYQHIYMWVGPFMIYRKLMRLVWPLSELIRLIN